MLDLRTNGTKGKFIQNVRGAIIGSINLDSQSDKVYVVVKDLGVDRLSIYELYLINSSF